MRAVYRGVPYRPRCGADDALAVIAVPGATAGVTVADVYDKIGQRGVVTPRVHFDQDGSPPPT